MKTNNDVKERILDYAETKFLKKGFSRVTTDDIAHDVGISKRTLYENFANKEEILTELIVRLQIRMNKNMKEISDRTDLNLVEKSKLMMERYNYYLRGVDKEFLEDIQKFSPKSLAILEQIRRDSFSKAFDETTRKALDEDLIRKDIPMDIISHLFFAMQSIIAERVLTDSNYSFKEITEYFHEILTNGLLTEKGRKMFIE
jgi:TetR/AcrR family transcriptional regulator, cholesterol catabolism regulator